MRRLAEIALFSILCLILIDAYCSEDFGDDSRLRPERREHGHLQLVR